MSHSYDELRALSDDELIKAHDELAKSTLVGSSYYVEELARRDAGKINASMLRFTRWITAMTAVMLFATIANIVIAVLK